MGIFHGYGSDITKKKKDTIRIWISVGYTFFFSISDRYPIRLTYRFFIPYKTFCPLFLATAADAAGRQQLTDEAGRRTQKNSAARSATQNAIQIIISSNHRATNEFGTPTTLAQYA
jgi:hypothetical protein